MNDPQSAIRNPQSAIGLGLLARADAGESAHCYEQDCDHCDEYPTPLVACARGWHARSTIRGACARACTSATRRSVNHDCGRHAERIVGYADVLVASRLGEGQHEVLQTRLWRIVRTGQHAGVVVTGARVNVATRREG